MISGKKTLVVLTIVLVVILIEILVIIFMPFFTTWHDFLGSGKAKQLDALLATEIVVPQAEDGVAMEKKAQGQESFTGLTIKCGDKVVRLRDLSCFNFSQINRLAIIWSLSDMSKANDPMLRAVYDRWCHILSDGFEDCDEKTEKDSDDSDTLDDDVE